MAIIGKVHNIRKFFVENGLLTAYDYFMQSLDVNSAVSKRIYNMPIGAFERQPLFSDIVALEQVFYTKDRDDCYIEAHKSFIDFQLVLSGIEQMEYIDVDKLVVKVPYDDVKDVAIYEDSEKTSKLVLECGDIAIFFPCDAHVGKPKFDRSDLVYKTVLKIPVGMVKGM